MTHAIPNRGSTAQPHGGLEDRTQAARRGARSRPGGQHTDPGGRPPLPVVGDEVFGFRLRQELGRGASAIVFLAEQADLAGRPVALKITDLEGDEPQTLAQLQHTHIVPIYSVHENREDGLRAVCMPYFGGATLGEVTKRLAGESNRPASGEQLLRALKIVSPPPLAITPSEMLSADNEPSLVVLRNLSFVRAAVWITTRLAEALQHAHQRGVIHLDIKPANILLGAGGEPMLLDFNVAQTTRPSQAQAVLGGTVAYMAPEHLLAMGQRDKTLAAKVDHRADIYSLGVVLYEMLAGSKPFGQTARSSQDLDQLEALATERSQLRPSLREKRADVPWSLESIVRKCLAPEASNRYQRAEDLAEDLRRFLEDRPLKYAPELSWRERVQKWLRRHPRLTSSGTVATVAAALLVGLGASFVGVRDHLARANETLSAVQAQQSKKAYAAGTVRTLCLINTTSELHDHLRQGVEVCEETLALYGVLDSDEWQSHPLWQRLSEADRQALAEDTRELLLALAWARVQIAPKDASVLTVALGLLDRAQAIDGLPSCRALWEDRARYLEMMERGAEADSARRTAAAISPATVRDLYLLATSHARRGRYAEAITRLSEALRLDPRHYWSLVQRGICYQELGKFTLATGDFGTCIGLWPEFAWGYFNRGYVLEKSGNRQEAIADYTAALGRDPDFVLALVNRGLARLELKQYEPALADFQHAATLGRDDASVHLGLGVALEGLKRGQEADIAFAAAFARAGSATVRERTRLSWVYGFAVSQRLPDKAREAFSAIRRQQPDHQQALYGLAMLATREGQDRAAIGLFDEALKSNPNFAEARRFRAVLLARTGQFDAAAQEINTCLDREPDVGATHYAAACVAALALQANTDKTAAKAIAEQALVFLGKAIALGYGKDTAATDPDLKALRTLPEFKTLMKGR